MIYLVFLFRALTTAHPGRDTKAVDAANAPERAPVVDWHADRGILALARVGRDRFKVWPLPVETPWFEVARKMPDDGLACRVREQS